MDKWIVAVALGNSHRGKFQLHISLPAPMPSVAVSTSIMYPSFLLFSPFEKPTLRKDCSFIRVELNDLLYMHYITT